METSVSSDFSCYLVDVVLCGVMMTDFLCNPASKTSVELHESITFKTMVLKNIMFEIHDLIITFKSMVFKKLNQAYFYWPEFDIVIIIIIITSRRFLYIIVF